jgi:hypothetical protein
MGRELEAPSAAEEKVHEDDGIVDFFGMEEKVTAQTPWMFGVIAIAGGREQGQIPVLCDVPVEGVEGVDEDEEEPV